MKNSFVFVHIILLPAAAGYNRIANIEYIHIISKQMTFRSLIDSVDGRAYSPYFIQ